MTDGREEAILQAVGFAAERFLAAADWRAAIDEVLKQLGLAAQASRAHLYSIDYQETEVYCSLIHEWAGGGVTAQIDNPSEQHFPLREGGYARWVEVLGSGEVIGGVRSELPESEREFMELEDIMSALAVPVFVEGRWWGWIGFDDTTSERDWLQSEMAALRTAAAIFGAAVQRERMERQRLNAEAKYRSLVEQLPSVTYMAAADAENRTLYVSPQIHDLLGYSPADWVKTRGLWMKLVHPDDLERAVGISEEANRTGDPISMEYRMRTRYGAELWVHEEAVLVRDDAKEPLYWQGVIIDVTEQKLAQAMLLETEARYRSLVEQLPAITYRDTYGPGPLLYISPQVEEITGYTTDEWLSGIWLSMIHPEDAVAVELAERQAEQGSGRFSADYRLIRKDGEVRWMHDEALPVLDNEGSPLYWQGVMVDFTDRHEIEVRLSDTEFRYRSLIENSPAATYVDTPDKFGTTTYMSPQIEKILGYPPETWDVDNVWLAHVAEDDREMVTAMDAHCAATGEPFDLEYRMVGADGEIVWIEEKAVQARDGEGQLRYWHGVIVDITARKKSQALEQALDTERGTSQRLRELDETKNTFIAALSHDFRTPLAVIMGLAMTMERDDLDLSDDEVHDFVGRIAAQSRKLDHLVTDLLDLERLSGDGGKVMRQQVDVERLVEAVIAELPPSDTRVHLECAEGVSGSLDRVKVERMVENLLLNALNHTPEGSDVWVSITREEGSTTILVDDSGPGVPDDLKEHVFEPFRKGDEADSRGVGVGLSLVKRFAESHGGRAWVADRSGGGASFGVRLPDENPPS